MGAKVYRSLLYCWHTVASYCEASTTQRSQDYDSPYRQGETVLRWSTKSWLDDELSSDVKELPQRADDKSIEETLVKAPNDEPSSELVYVKTAENKLICEPKPEEESALSTNIDYEVDSTQATDRPIRKVRAPKYLQEYVRRIPANEQNSD